MTALQARSRRRQWLSGVAAYYPVVIVIVLWEVIARSGAVSPRLFPDLPRIVAAFVDGMKSGDIPYHAGISVVRALTGFALAIVVGVVAGTVMARLRIVEMLVEPLFAFGYPVPKIALYPVFIFIFGLGTGSKIALVFLECLFPIALNTFYGIRGVDKKLVWAAQNMGAGYGVVFFKVLLPSTLPAILSGLRIALPLALVVVIVTEMIGESRGLGYYISYAAASFEFPDAYAGIFTIGVIGFVFDQILLQLRKKLLSWDNLLAQPPKS